MVFSLDMLGFWVLGCFVSTIRIQVFRGLAWYAWIVGRLAEALKKLATKRANRRASALGARRSARLLLRHASSDGLFNAFV